MRYLIALLIPPLALLLCGKIFQFLISLVLCVVVGGLFFVGIGFFLIWIPALHAILVVSSYNADQRNKQLINAVRSK
jgi:hypothetical protein